MAISAQEISKLRQAIFKITRLAKKHTISAPFSATEMNIIGHLDRSGELLPSELAMLEHVSAQAISQNIKNLLASQFITQLSDDNDKRKTKIALSPYGKSQVTIIKNTRDDWFAQALAQQLGEKEMEILKNAIPILEKVSDHLKI